MKVGKLCCPKRECLGMFFSVERMKEALVDQHRYGAWSCEWTAQPEDSFVVLRVVSFGHPVCATDPVVAAEVLTKKGVFWTWLGELK